MEIIALFAALVSAYCFTAHAILTICLAILILVPILIGRTKLTHTTSIAGPGINFFEILGSISPFIIFLVTVWPAKLIIWLVGTSWN